MEALEAVHPLALLTRDGWIHIFARLDKPKDWWNTANVHPLFLSIFQSELREKWLTALFFGCVPHLLNFLPFPKVLELRLLDREIKSTIDQRLEQGQVTALKYYKNKIELKRELRGNRGPHLDRRRIRRWMNLEVECFDVDVVDRFEEFLILVRRYGPQVFKATVSAFDYEGVEPWTVPYEFTPFLPTYASLRNLLIFLPNLEALELRLCIRDPDDQELPLRWSADILIGFMRDNPLPPLPSLKNLTVSEFGWPKSETCAFLGAFAQCYGTHLNKLDFWGPGANLPKGMSHLRQLELKLETTEQLASFQAFAAPLEVLTVNIVENSPILPSQLFLALQPFQKTLKTLSLETHRFEFDEVEQVPVELPRVEKLVLVGGFSEFSECTGNRLRFLDSFKNLKELVFSLVHLADQPIIHTHLRSFYSKWIEEGQFYKSNRWIRPKSLKQTEDCTNFGRRMDKRMIWSATWVFKQ